MPVTTVQRFQQALQAVGAEDSRQGRQDALCPVLEQASRYVAATCLALANTHFVANAMLMSNTSVNPSRLPEITCRAYRTCYCSPTAASVKCLPNLTWQSACSDPSTGTGMHRVPSNSVYLSSTLTNLTAVDFGLWQASLTDSGKEPNYCPVIT